MPNLADHERLRARSWFLSRGLPMVLGSRVRADRLWWRPLPVAVGITVLELLAVLLLVLVDGPEAEVERRYDNPWWVTAFVLLGVGVLVVPLICAALTAKLLPTRAPVRYVALAAATLLMPVVLLLWPAAASLSSGFWLDLGQQLGIYLVLTALTYVGAGSVLWWTTRFAVRQLGALGTMAGRALPLLMLTVLVFFTGELWQWASVIPRVRVWQTIGLLAVVALAFLATSLRDELGVLARADHREAELAGLLAGTPLASAAGQRSAHRPLGRGERLNVLVVLLVAQAVQVVMFTILVLAFFLVLGIVMLPHQLIETWSGHPITGGTWFGLRVPLPSALLNMSLLVAVIAGLYFTVSSTNDPQYRDRFYEPLLHDVAVSLAVRRVYLERWPGER